VAKGRDLAFWRTPPALLLRTCVCSESGPAAKAAPPGKAALLSTRFCVYVYLKITHATLRSKVFRSFLIHICELGGSESDINAEMMASVAERKS
jgi:hypothetical protein